MKTIDKRIAIQSQPDSLGKFRVRYKNKRREFKTLTGECFPSIHGDKYILMVLTKDDNPNETVSLTDAPAYRTLKLSQCLDVKAS